MANNMYSIKTKGFYPSDAEDQKPFITAGTLPDDLKEISDEDYNAFFNPPDGYYGVFDDTGPHLEKNPEPDTSAANLNTAHDEYDKVSADIVALQQRIDDEDYDAVNTEQAVADAKTKLVTYRKALRAYIAAGDGTKDVPVNA